MGNKFQSVICHLTASSSSWGRQTLLLVLSRSLAASRIDILLLIKEKIRLEKPALEKIWGGEENIFLAASAKKIGCGMVAMNARELGGARNFLILEEEISEFCQIFVIIITL